MIREAGGGVLAVVIQYRLGLFGFLPGEKVKESGVLNAGLCKCLVIERKKGKLPDVVISVDQQAALQWVQKHVSEWSIQVVSRDTHPLFRSANSVETLIKLLSGGNQLAQVQFCNRLSQMVEIRSHHFSELQLPARPSCRRNTTLTIAFLRCVHVFESNPTTLITVKHLTVTV